MLLDVRILIALITSIDSLKKTKDDNIITMCGGDDAIDEENLLLCCALCCVNCSLYPDLDCFGCSGKVRNDSSPVRLFF